MLVVQPDFHLSIDDHVEEVADISLSDQDLVGPDLHGGHVRHHAFHRGSRERREEGDLPNEGKCFRVRRCGPPVDRKQLTRQDQDHDRQESTDHDERGLYAEHLDEDGGADGSDREREHAESLEHPEHTREHLVRGDALEQRATRDVSEGAPTSRDREQDRSAHG